SHHEPSICTLGSERSQAISSCVSRDAVVWRTPPGPAVLTRRIAQSAPLALVANTLLPSTTKPPSTFCTVVPKRIFSLGARACGSPLQATHLWPFSTTSSNQRDFCSAFAIPSRRTSEFTCPSQQRA